MKKQIKTLIMAGLITVVTGSNIVNSHAASKTTTYKTYKSKVIYVDSNGHLHVLKDTCGNNDDNVSATPGNINDDNTVTPETAPDITPDDKPSKPDVDIPNNEQSKPEENAPNNGVESPENKPENNNSFSAYQKEILNLVNKEREKVGAKPLTLNSELSNVATIKSQDMIDNNYFDHNSPTYGSPFDMMKKFKISYKTAGENIAMGQKTPAEVMNAWMNSPGHRKNILNANFTEIGVGIATAPNGQIYWTQMFIGK